MHPNIKYYLYNDDEIDEFFQDQFTLDYVNMIKTFTLGVMISDTWRMAFAYIYGGIYADTDVRPLKPYY